jgi:hypothetical protein
MSWSLGETRALAVKAARGAGMMWGLAEEAGFAVHQLQANGAPGVQALAEYLIWREQADHETTAVWRFVNQPKASHSACPIELGARILDTGDFSGWSNLGPVCKPLLLVPFLAASAFDGDIALTWKESTIVISQQGLTTTTPEQELLTECARCRLEQKTGVRPTFSHFSRVPETMNRHIAVLETLAARTYAPATDQSRLAGAGAGTDDND